MLTLERPVYEKHSLLSIEAGDHLKWLIAKAAHEARELVVVHQSKREDWRGDTLAEGVPHSVTFLPH
jgi:hypothetical protein